MDVLVHVFYIYFFPLGIVAYLFLEIGFVVVTPVGITTETVVTRNKITLNFDISPKKEKKHDIFSQTAGLLSSQNIDPIAWQNQMRSEWDR